jgi:hypothetical protein
VFAFLSSKGFPSQVVGYNDITSLCRLTRRGSDEIQKLEGHMGHMYESGWSRLETSMLVPKGIHCDHGIRAL